MERTETDEFSVPCSFMSYNSMEHRDECLSAGVGAVLEGEEDTNQLLQCSILPLTRLICCVMRT